jgi:hypothetical protein
MAYRQVRGVARDAVVAAWPTLPRRIPADQPVLADRARPFWATGAGAASSEIRRPTRGGGHQGCLLTATAPVSASRSILPWVRENTREYLFVQWSG